MRPSRSVVSRLAGEIRVAGQLKLIPKSDADAIAKALEGKSTEISIVLYEPIQVEARYSTYLADLRYARCSKCGKVYDLSKLDDDKVKNLKCSDECGGRLILTPVWCISGRTFPSSSSRRLTTQPSQGAKLVLSVEDYTVAKFGSKRTRGGMVKKPDRIVARDMSRPMSSIEFIYPQDKSHGPKFSVKRGNFDYVLSSMPMESITKPITVTAFAYEPGKCIELKTTTGSLNGIETLLLCKDLEVLQTTVLYKVGHPRSSSWERVSVIDMEKDERTGVQISLPTRYITTSGIVIKINSESVRSSLDKLGYKSSSEGEWTALHTISHAFLVNLPRITGLEGNDFGEAIDTSNREIAIFDNSMGGLGGVEGVTSNGILAPNYEWSIRDSHKCPLACMRACKACLYTDSCFMLNWRLDRRIIKELGW